MAHVFISYARKDKSFAYRLKAKLDSEGYSTWLDTSSLDTSEDFTGEIEYAIKDSSHFVVCLTEDVTRKDSFVRREIAYALNVDRNRSTEIPQRRLPIIPIIFPSGELPLQISTWTGIFFEKHKHLDDFYSEVRSRLHEAPKLGDLEYVIPGNTPEIVNYLNALLEFSSSKLHDTVYSLLTLAATSNISESISKTGFSFTFSVSPAIATSKRFEESQVDFESFQEAFESQKAKALMIGKPGAGKTTTLLAYARDLAAARLSDSAMPIPVLKSIHTWHPRTRVKKWLFGEFGSYKGNKKSDFVFILDGLDELGDKLTVYRYQTQKGKEKTCYSLDEIPFDEDKQKEQERLAYSTENVNPRELFLNELHFLENDKLIISVREDTLTDIQDYCKNLGKIYLQSLDYAQVESFFLNLSLPEVWEKAKSDPSLIEMFRIPLLLGLFTFAVMPIPGQPPIDIIDLTEDRILDLFVQRRFLHETSRPRELPFDEPTTRHLLSELAGNLMISTESSIVAFDFLEIEKVAVNRKTANLFLDFCQRMHFFQKTADDKTIFVHLKLRDFFAVRGLISRLQSGSRLEREGSAQKLGELKNVISVPVLINTLIHDENAIVKATAMIVLLGFNTDESVAECFRQLRREKNQTLLSRFTAILDQYHDQKAISLLVEMAYDGNKSGLVFNWLGGKLAEFGDSALVRLFDKLGEGDKTSKLISLILFRRFKNDRRIFNHLVPLLDEADTDIKIEAIRSISNYGKDSASHLLRLIDEKNLISVQLEVISALGKTNEEVTTNRLARVLHDPSKRIRLASIEALGHQGSNYAISELCNFLSRDDLNERERLATINVMEKIGDSEVVPYLLKNLKGKSKKIRRATISALGFCCGVESVAVLIPALDLEIDLEFTKALAQLIGKLRDLDYLPKFHEMLNSSNYDKKRKAVIVLGEYKHHSSIPKLVDLLADKDKEIQLLVVTALRKFPNPDALNIVSDWQSKRESFS